MPTLRIGEKLRPWQRETWERLERFNCIVAHRRSGKTVLSTLWLLSRCLRARGGVGAYVCPKLKQAKRISWGMFQKFAPPGTHFNNAELKVTLPNGVPIYVLATDADNGDSIRGLGVVAAVLDETAQISPYAWFSVIRPALADYQGELLSIGTPLGRVGLFWDMHLLSRSDAPNWFGRTWSVHDTNALPPAEVAQLEAELDPAAWGSEFKCDWDAQIRGAYWSAELYEAEKGGRITEVPHETSAPVVISMDLGISDACSCWAWQPMPGGRVNAIWWKEYQNKGLVDIVREIRQHYKWDISHWIVPHDAKVREFGSGRSREAVMQKLGCNTVRAPFMPVRDGIEAVRSLLPNIWFDREGCGDGVEYLKQYRAEYVENRGVFQKQPLHNFASHASDSVRYFATAWHDGLIHDGGPLDWSKHDEGNIYAQA